MTVSYYLTTFSYKWFIILVNWVSCACCTVRINKITFILLCFGSSPSKVSRVHWLAFGCPPAGMRRGGGMRVRRWLFLVSKLQQVLFGAPAARKHENNAQRIHRRSATIPLFQQITFCRVGFRVSLLLLIRRCLFILSSVLVTLLGTQAVPPSQCCVHGLCKFSLRFFLCLGRFGRYGMWMMLLQIVCGVCVVDAWNK